MARSIRASMMRIFCPRKNPKIQESCKSKAIRRTGAKGQLKNARRNKKRLGFNLPPPSLCFFGFSNGLSIYIFIFQAAPQALDKDIVHAASFAVHADPNAGSLQHAGE